MTFANNNTLTIYQPRIKGQVDELVKQLTDRKGQPVDVSAWSMFFSFDVMGDVGFSKDLGNMTTGQEHPALRQMHGFIRMFGVVQAIPWLPNLLSGIPGATRGVAGFYELCNEILAEKQQASSLLYLDMANGC